jgi:uncharacterized protein YcfJ
MARPHHRKKHKEHLRQFQHRGDINTTDAKGKGSNVFAIVGGVVGMAILYFATQGDIIWGLGGAVAGGFVGYLLGKSIDKSAKK